MGRLSLLSVGLFVLPIAITIGALIGYESYAQSRGQKGLAPRPNNGVTVSEYCQKAYGVQITNTQFVFNPNQWGTETIGPGSSLCMNVSFSPSPHFPYLDHQHAQTASNIHAVTEFNNETYATSESAPPWTATWVYPVGPVTEPVHAFPNAKLNLTGVIPVQLSNVSSLSIDHSWTYGIGTEVATSTDGHILDVNLLNANVCIDMFMDSDESLAGLTNVSAYEVMIWFGRYGPATLPIGQAEGSLETQVAGGVAFDLYYGPNSLGQKVFTWVAEANTTTFSGDVNILVEHLADHGGPVDTDYLGYMAFGSEALSSGAEVTFSVPELRIDLTTQ